MAVTKKEVISIKPVVMNDVTIRIVGDTPLIVHKWSEKAKKQLRDSLTNDKQGVKKKHEAKNPFGEFAQAIYWMDGDPDIDYYDWTPEVFEEKATGARFGFPSMAIKKAAISSAYRNGFSKDKVSLMGAFTVMGEGSGQLVEIHSDELPEMREDNVTVNSGGADLRYRPEFANWYMDLHIRYNENGILSLSDIVNIINLGGQTNGIGEWRTEKSGVYGAFHVESSN